MALIVEDGTSVVGANTYISADFARQYALDRGVTIPSATNIDAQIIMAADYLEGFDERYKGRRSSPSQSLSWPRTNVVIYGSRFPINAIPDRLKQAQAQAFMEVFAGADLTPNVTGYAVRREKVDVLEVEYATGGGTNNSATPQFAPQFPKIDVLLKPLLGSTFGGQLEVVRA